MIVWQAQPTNNTCGQTCLAMLLGVDVSLVRLKLGIRPTSAATLASFVNRRGFRMPHKLVRWPPPSEHPARMLVRLKKRGTKTGHWVLVENDVSHDPLWPNRRDWSRRTYDDWFQTGYLPITRKARSTR